MTSFSKNSLYSLTVQPPSAVQQAIAGDFSGPGKQQILRASGTRLILSEIRRKQRDLVEIYAQDTFGIIRHIDKFRLAGATKDNIVITTDSGRLVTYEYHPEAREFKTIHSETFGKSAIRRVVPGEYLATDPKGRAVMVASVEKNKLVYILTRSGQTEIAISSPLEAHKKETLVYSVIGLDVGYDNPMFAALELDFSSAESDPSPKAEEQLEKELVYYELDLGLNHIVRKWSEPVDRTSNMLFRVPTGKGVPGGVLCCGEDNISYRRILNRNEQVHRLAIPRREGATEDPRRKRIIVAGDMYNIKGGMFFYLLQTDDGDIFKVTMKVVNNEVDRMMIKYFDTIPIATNICILKAGFVDCASESGDRTLYELQSLGDDTPDPLFESTQFPVDPKEKFDPPFFRPRKLTNLSQSQIFSSKNPMIDMEVANLTGEEAPQIYTVSGLGARSSFRTTRNALDVLDLIEAELPDQGTQVWTTKLSSEDEFDSLLVFRLISRTLVLKVGDDVNETQNTGFITDTDTIGVQQFGDDGILQIHPRGIRLIRRLTFPDELEPTKGDCEELVDWDCPPHRTIIAYAANTMQVAIALSTGEIMYFECDDEGGLSKADEEIKLDIIHCLAIPEVPEGSRRAFFLAVGAGETVRIYNLSPDMEGEILKDVSLYSLSKAPSSLAINYMSDKSSRGYSQYIHIGLRSGVYIRAVLDEQHGSIDESRRRVLGHTPVQLALVRAAEEPAIVAITSRPWLSYTHPTTKENVVTPLNYTPFEAAWYLHGTGVKGVISVKGDTLRIFSINNLVSNTASEKISLKYTPRKLAGYHDMQLYYVIESDNNTIDEETRDGILKEGLGKNQLAKQMENGIRQEDEDVNMDDQDSNEAKEEAEEKAEEKAEEGTCGGPTQFGYPRAPGRWASCIQVVDPVHDKAVIETIELKMDQTAISAALVTFESRNNEVFLAVGVATGLVFYPAYHAKSSAVHLYKASEDGRSLKFYHETEVDEPPHALLAFKGKLLVGAGKDLSLYDCGMRSLLRKAQAVDCTSTRITGLRTQGSRVVVSDIRESVTYVVHKDLVHPNRLIPFVDDNVPRHTTCTDMLDYDATVGGDKFGNIWVVRCPTKISEASDESIDGQHLIQDKSYLGGAPNRVDLIASHFVNDIPVSIQKTNLIVGGEKIVVWAGLQGTIGAMIPFASRRTFKLFQQLEMALRTIDKPISGRDHLAFRSYYTPVKAVLDGDLIERFLILNDEKRQAVMGQVNGNWSVDEVDEEIYNMRFQYCF